MAFPQKSKMPPPGAPKKKPGLMIAIGVGPAKKPGMPPPSLPDSKQAAEDGHASKGGGDTPADPETLERAGIVRADKHCQNCENWDPSTGNCSVLGPGFAPDDACLRYFEAMDDQEDDNDADDQGSGDTGDTGEDQSSQGDQGGGY